MGARPLLVEKTTPPKTLKLDRSSMRPVAAIQLAFANRAKFAQQGAPAHFTGLFIIFALTKLPGNPASFEEFLKAAQSCANWLTIMNAHSQWHAYSWFRCSKD